MSITITAKHDGYRRCGIAHSTKPTTYPDDRFSVSDLSVLRADPHLIVVEGDADVDSIAAAAARSAVDEAGKAIDEAREETKAARSEAAAARADADAARAELESLRADAKSSKAAKAK